MLPILEHEILKVLYTKARHITISQGSEQGITRAIYQRDYDKSFLEFGYLADLLNNPEKYESPKDFQDFFTKSTVDISEISTSKFSLEEISEAVDVLIANGQVTSRFNEGEAYARRTICLTHKGAIDYRNNFYIKYAWEHSINRMDAEKEQLRSSIDANKSTKTMNEVILPRTFSQQKKTNIITASAAVVSVVFITISTTFQCNDKSPQELQGIKDTLSQTRRTIDSIVPYLKEINSSLQNRKDTVVVKTIEAP